MGNGLKKFSQFRVVKAFDDCAGEWDGDQPLDSRKEWTPYVLTLEGLCDACEEWLEIDSVAGCWASNDRAGELHIRDAIAYYLLPSVKGQRKPGKKTIDIVELA